MELKIYSGDGVLKFSVEPRDNGTQVEEIQAGNVLTLSFTMPERIFLEVNDYVDFMERRYWLTEKYHPVQKSTVEWEYSLKFYGLENLISRFLVLNDTDGANEPVFTLTASPREHVALIVKSINAGFGTNDWKVGTVEAGDNIVVDYHGKYCNEGLKAVAEMIGTEYWIEGTTVNLCRCEHGERIALGYQNGLTKIQPDVADNAKVYTRLFPVGSSKNIDPAKYGYNRLQLPGGMQYVDINTDKYGIIHHYEENAFADIFPRYTGTITGVRSEEHTDDSGDKFTVYYFKDEALPFDPNQYDLGGLVKRVTFQEGSELAGLGNDDSGTHYFEVNFNSETWEFEIITQFNDAGALPGGILVPRPGDRYIPWNMRMPDEYYALAEAELLDAVQEYNCRHSIDVACYKVSTDYEDLEKRGIDLHVGQRVRFVSSEYFPETGYKDSRITKITRKINCPAQMDLEISDALSTGAIDQIKGSIDEVKAYARAARAGVPDIVKTGDNTPFTDNNLLSALRSCREFLSKLKDDRAKGKIASDIGFEVGNYLAGVSGGMFGIDKVTGDSFAEVMRLYVRGKAYFETLTIIEANTLAGKQYITPGGSIKCSKVEAIKDENSNVTAYRCYFLSEQDGEKTETKIVAGDQAISEMFNAKAGTTNKVSNHRYWRLVTAVDNDAYTDESGNHYGYIDLSSTDCEAGSDVPREGDVIDQLGNRNDRTRQAAMIFSTVDADAPSIKLLTGIDSYTFVNKDVISQGYDPAKGSAFFKCFGDVYLGSRNGNTYVKYDEATDTLDVKAKISVLSTIGDKTIDEYFNSKIDVASDKYKYLTQALSQNTDIAGGVVLSTLISLGYKDADNVRHTLAGINGLYLPELEGRTIVAWYGGKMVDRFDSEGKLISPAPIGAATSLVRLDGSAYWANGNIGFEADGSAWLGSYEKGVRIGKDGSLTVGSGVTFNVSNVAGLKTSLESLANFNIALEAMLVPVDEDGNELEWLNSTKAVALKARKNFCAAGDIVAEGWQTPGEDDVPVVGALSDLTDVKLSELTAGDLIQWNGEKFVNVRPSELGISGAVDLSNVLHGVSLDVAGDFDANALTDKYVVYDPAGDMQDGSGKWVNFPDTKPNGGFVLINFKEGGYKKQLYTTYDSNRLYIRNTHWDNSTKKAAWSAWDSFALMSDLSNYVRKSGDTMTGTLNVANIQEPGGNGLITYHPTSWTGVSNTQWGVGTVDSQGVIRSSNASLIHYRNGVGNSTILDTGNITLAANATFSTYVAAISCGIAVRYGNTNSYGAMRPYDTVLDVGNGSYARFFRLMHNRQDGNLRFQGSTNADSTSTAAWGTERTLIDSVNYASILDKRYVSCFWTNTPGYNCNQYADTSFITFTYKNNAPFTGGVAHFVSNGYGFYLGTDYYSDAPLYYRRHGKSTDGGMGSWRTLLDNVNYASILDGRYVKKAGDTMTGALTIGTQQSGAAGANKTWLTIYPVYHTGGPWHINSYDTASTAYLRIMYNTTASFTLSHSGEITTPGDIKSVRTGAAAQVIASRDGRVVSLHSDSNRGVYDNSGSGWLIGTNGTNTFLMRGNVGIGKTDPGYSLDANGQIRANGWLRTIGNVGWYNETHGGGWFMQDSTWIRTYNSKAVYTGSGRIRSDHLFDRQVYGGSSWNNGYGAYNIAIVNNSSQTPLLLAYRSGIEPTNATGANRLFSMEFLNNGTDLRFYFGGNHRFTFYSNGNFESLGDQIVGSSSDRRLKHRFAVEGYTERILRLGAVMSYEWNETARALDPDKYDTVRHTSVVWQRARKVGLPGFCGVDDRGYGFVNWLNKDYQASLLGAVQQTIRTVLRHDDEIRRLRGRVVELETEIRNYRRA